MNPIVDASEELLLRELRDLIDAARARVAVVVNAEMTLLYWQVGIRIRGHVLQGERAAYGEQVMAGLAHALSAEFGRGWGVSQLRKCLQFAQSFPDKSIVDALRPQLTWTHLRALMVLEDPLKRDFYLSLCRQEGWFIELTVIIRNCYTRQRSMETVMIDDVATLRVAK